MGNRESPEILQTIGPSGRVKKRNRSKTGRGMVGWKFPKTYESQQSLSHRCKKCYESLADTKKINRDMS